MEDHTTDSQSGSNSLSDGSSFAYVLSLLFGALFLLGATIGVVFGDASDAGKIYLVLLACAYFLAAIAIRPRS